MSLAIFFADLDTLSSLLNSDAVVNSFSTLSEFLHYF